MKKKVMRLLIMLKEKKKSHGALSCQIDENVIRHLMLKEKENVYKRTPYVDCFAAIKRLIRCVIQLLSYLIFQIVVTFVCAKEHLGSLILVSGCSHVQWCTFAL